MKTPITTKVAITLLGIGIVSGLVIFLNRSPEIISHRPADNAVPAHIALAIIASVIFALAYSSYKKRDMNVFLAPFTMRAWKRLRMTLTLKPRLSLVGIIKWIVTVPLVLLMAFFFFRSGMQLIAMFDPNFVINAWGGPTAIGASIAHWMDGIIMFYAEALILSIVMVRAKH